MGSIEQIGSPDDKHLLDCNAPLWRYVPLKNLFFYLAGNILIPSVQKLRQGDPFEGEFHSEPAWFNRAMHDCFGDNHEKAIHWIHRNLCSEDERETIDANRTIEHAGLAFRCYQERYLHFIRTTRFAWCWYHSALESAAMWNTYGLQGAAVVSKVGMIKSMLERKGFRGAYRSMRYYRMSPSGQIWSFNPELSPDKALLLRPYFLKRHEYRSEEEVRFVITDTRMRGRDFIVSDDVPPSHWIERVVLGPGLSSQQKDGLRRAVGAFDADIRCDASALLHGSDEQERERLAEMNKWLVSSDDGIPEFFKLT